MLRKRTQLELNIRKILKSIATDKPTITRYINYLINKYGLDEKMSSDIVTLRRDVETLDDRMLYIAARLVKDEYPNSGVNPDFYYTPKEIKEYDRKVKLSNKDIFPIKWDMIEISPNQYIGSISVKELMQLRDHQKINYNENAQRAMKQVVNGDDIIYMISINKAAIAGIKQSFLEETYIPNTLTLNIPTEEEFRYVDGQIVIDSIDHFDILDGYHRYLAISEIYNLDNDFDYKMELRVVSFSDERAKQFIWQEDQKTKMKKIDSDMYNQNSYSNQVISLLNETPLLRGTFTANIGIINPAVASRLLSITFFGERNKRYTKKDLLDVKSYVYRCFTELIAYDEDILNNKWEYEQIISFFFAMWKLKEPMEVPGFAEKVYNCSKEETYSYLFSNTSFRRCDIIRLDKAMEEVATYV